ncbi:diguanylate cyclase [Quadrisphaera sp. KR29]|uniref:diguanylate cyclase n=1 Tax=Quadrisphaera sp. KR29 TaxID=3461391 RepID=UPI00404397AF
MRSWRTWLPWAVVVALAVLAMPTAVAPGSPAASTAYLVGSVVLVACTWAGALASRGGGRAPWVLVAATTTCWLAGDATHRVLDALDHEWGELGPPDAFWLASYPLLGAAVVLVVRSRGLARPVLQAVALDATVATAAVAAIAWQLLVEPGLRGGGSAAELVVQSLYPLGDIGIFALAMTLLMAPGRRGASTVLLLVCLGLTLPLDLLYTVVMLAAPAFDPARLDAAFLVVNGCLGAAAVHRDRALLTTSAPHRGGWVLQRWRLLLLGGSLTTVLVMAAVRGTGLWDLVPSLAGALVLALTVVARFHLLVRDQEAARAALEHQAHHDQLTGAANRVLLHRRLAEAAGTDGAVLLFLDLDGFKAVNDVHGHRAGDLVLRAVADRLRAAVRAGDVVARMGGDEFVALCFGVPADQVDALGGRLEDAVRRPVDVTPAGAAGTTAVSVGVSVGVLRLGGDAVAAGRAVGEDDVDLLLRRADEAMYRAKGSGGGVVTAAAPLQPAAG